MKIYSNKITREVGNVNHRKGFSLVELLIVVTIFAILSVIGTQIITVSLRSTTKSEEMSIVREDMDFVLNVINRQLRNAEAINCTTSNGRNLYFTNADGENISFQCDTVQHRMMLDGRRLNSVNTQITNCNTTNVFICNPGTASSSPNVTVNLTARNATNSTSIVTSSINIVLRSF